MSRFIAFIGLGITTFLLWFYFYVTASYPQGQWWQELGNDIDGIHATTTVGLLNNSDYRYVYHPAATVFNLHGLTERVLSFFSEKHAALFELEKIKDENDVAALIETATRTSRWLTFFMTIATVFVLFLLLQSLTRNFYISIATTFYIMTSRGHLEHLTMVRAEIYSVFFVLLAALLFALIVGKTIQTKSENTLWIMIGTMSVLAVLSKIQILPAVLLLVVVILFYLFSLKSESRCDMKSWMFWAVNLFVFPWWTLRCPSEMRGESALQFSSHDDLRHVYGNVPVDNFFMIPLIWMILLAVLLIIGQIKKENRIVKIANVGLLFTLGLSLGIYYILAPVSGSLSQYFSNTQHLIYATVSNITGGGFLQNRVFGWETVKSVLQRLYFGDLWFVSMRWLVIGFSLFLLVKTFVDKKDRFRWVFVLIWFVLAFGMDCLATMRSKSYYSYYFIYTITFYGIGMGLTVNEILNHLKNNQIKKVVVLFLSIFFASYVFWRGTYIVKKQLVCTYSPSDPSKEWQSLRSQTEPFWKVVEERSGLRKQ